MQMKGDNHIVSAPKWETLKCDSEPMISKSETWLTAFSLKYILSMFYAFCYAWSSWRQFESTVRHAA